MADYSNKNSSQATAEDERRFQEAAKAGQVVDAGMLTKESKKGSPAPQSSWPYSPNSNRG